MTGFRSSSFFGPNYRSFYTPPLQVASAEGAIITDEDRTILHAAGLYAARKDKDEQWQLSCAVITTDAKDAVGEVHDWMPVFLSEELASDWLHPGPRDSAEEMTARLADAAEAGAQSLQVRKVSQRVNNTRTVDRTDPTLISAID